MEHQCHGILINIKKGQTTDICSNLDGSSGNYAEWGKKASSKGYIVHDSVYITF